MIVALAFALALAPADGLTWHAPAQCPTAATMAARAEALGASARDAQIEFVEIPGGYEATIARSGQLRTLQSPSCDELATAIALSFVTGATTPEPPPEPEPNEDAPLLPEPQHTEASPARDAASTSTETRVDDRPREPSRRKHHPTPVLGPALVASGHAGFGLLPRVDLGGGGAFAWRGRGWAVEIGGFALAPNRVQREGIDVRASLAAGSVAGCGRVVWRWFELRPCAALQVGATIARTRSPALRPLVRNAWVGVGASMRAMAWVHDRVAIALGVGMVIPARQTEYRKADTLITPARPIAFAASVGLEIAIGRRSR
jgi:hypothetical protein